ncbi:MAG: hypothetical protein KF749_16720 [Bacteroidetes bacterium]|nr:hypothetical protein [Bacteroidota bacterium]MCW5895589.1 hypothetical protein [Bacteroidota bacterium]
MKTTQRFGSAGRTSTTFRRIKIPTVVVVVVMVFSSLSAGQTTKTQEGFFGVPLHVTVSAHAGYGFVNMQQINNVIQEVGTIRRVVDSRTREADVLSGGFYWDGSILIRLNRFFAGVGFSSLTVSGQSDYKGAVSLLDKLSGRTSEYLLLIGVRFPGTERLFIDLFVGGGYCKAMMDYTGEYHDNFNSSNDILFKQSLAHSFLSVRTFGVAGARYGIVSLRLLVGYRLANAGVMKGRYVLNGQTSTTEEPFVDFRGNEVKWDFSGLLLGGGVSVEF